MYYIGIDLGTSAMKLLLVDEEGKIRRSVSREYPLSMPRPGWSEQNPMDWWSACLIGTEELLAGFDRSEVAGIGCGGQMHGLVVLDENDEVIRDAILWNDGRTSDEVDYLNDTIGREVISGYTANIAFAGFTAPKLLWMRKHEPENFARISKIMLPKDYINYKLTGVHSCDYSDASGMLLLDVRNRKWSSEMLEICSVREDQMPRLFESYEVIGCLRPEIATALSLPEDVKVVAGAGDNAAAAVGTGTVGDGKCNISIGTSGTVFISSDRFGKDMNNALHSFAHADGHYHLMGCMLSAASCNKWFCDEIIREKDYDAVQSEISADRLGENEVFFLPYLMGERSPINDTDARGVFLGMSMNTTRADMAQAILEGVAFAIKDNIEVARSVGIKIERSKICGGGARSRLWQTIFSSVLDIPLDIPVTEEGPGYGGAMLAMVGTGLFSDVRECAEALTRIKDTVLPDPGLAAKYEKRYSEFKRIYPSIRSLFREIRRS
ncbi:MAG: xylulokinase [Oscillospiraceae bacterium]|nr:xylulokinase [Oscillospiraceae bacterium]